MKNIFFCLLDLFLYFDSDLHISVIIIPVTVGLDKCSHDFSKTPELLLWDGSLKIYNTTAFKQKFIRIVIQLLLPQDYTSTSH